MRPVDVAEFLAALERLAPARLAEEWDNVGLLVGRADRPVTGVLVALDLRDGVLDEAEAHSCNLVLTHHPAIFPSLAAVSDASAAGRLVLRSAELGIAIVAAHTNLDSAAQGLNDQMAEMIGLTDMVPLRPRIGDPTVGLGRVGRAPAGSTLGDLVTALGVAFADAPRRFVGSPDRPIDSVAVCTGSGASLIDDAAAAGAHVYVTGDLKYHDADRAFDLALVSVPHATVERITLRAWCTLLERELAGVPVRFAEVDTDPWATPR